MLLSYPKAQSPKVTSPCSTAQVWDIMPLKWAFPNSFNTIGNMPSTYTIRTDPSAPLVQHTWQKVPIEYWEQIKCTVNDMVTKGLIAPRSQLTKWVSLLTYPHMSDGSLHICLDPRDLNKALVQEHYKAPMMDKISHSLSGAWSMEHGATCFSKLDAKDGFLSIHLDENSSYLTMFNTHHGRYSFLHISFGLNMFQDVFLALLPFMMIYAYLAIPLRSMMSTYCAWWRLRRTMALSSTVLSATSGSLRFPFMVEFLLPRTCSWILPKSKPSRTFSPWFRGKASVLPRTYELPVTLHTQPIHQTTFLWEQLAEWDWNPSTDAASASKPESVRLCQSQS